MIDPNAKPQNTDLIVSVHGDESSSYAYATYNLAYLSSASICYAFCLTPEEITDKLVKSSECKDGVPEGKIGMRLMQADGSYSYEDNCGGKEIIATIKFNFIVDGAAAARMHRR